MAWRHLGDLEVASFHTNGQRTEDESCDGGKKSLNFTGVINVVEKW